jgi:outer membrane protein TolC
VNSQQLPCLTSSNECVEILTDRAIASSPKLQKLSERITIIDERLKVTGERIDYTKKKRWTNYISTNPVEIVQNIFGGGGVQRDTIAIADLEIKTADLLAAKAELERQQEEEKVRVGDKVLRLLLDYEAASRRHQLLSSQLETLEQQREVTRIAYKFGRGSTSQILGMEDRRDRLSEQITDVEIKRDGAVRELIQLTKAYSRHMCEIGHDVKQCKKVVGTPVQQNS